MNTENGEVPTSIKFRASIGLSACGKHALHTKGRRQEHRPRGSRSRNSSTMYSLDEVGQLVSNSNVHKLAVRTSESDLCLQKVQPAEQTDSCATLDSEFSMRTTGCGYNYDDVQRGTAMELLMRARKSEKEFSFDGSNRQPIEAGESYINKLTKQTSDIRECGETVNKLRKTDQEDIKCNIDSADFESCCAGAKYSLKLSEARLRTLSRNTYSSSECSSKSQERRVSKWSSNVDNQELENYKNLSSQYQEAVDFMNRSKRTTDCGPMSFDTKTRNDLDGSVTPNNRDCSRHNESVLGCQTYQDVGIKKQHSILSRNPFAATNQKRALGQETFSFEEHATESIPKEASRREDSRQLRKILNCDHTNGETSGTDKNFSYSQNFGDSENFTTNPEPTKQRLWEQTILEESTVSADTSQCPHSSIEGDATGELQGPTPRLKNITKKRHSLDNSDQAIVVQMSRGHQRKACSDWLIGDWKWKKHFRQCSTTVSKEDTISKNEHAKDETTVHCQWRANVYGTGSTADAANTSSEDDGAGASLWTCTKWSDENTDVNLQQSKESQWAYEVYSNTCQKAAEQTSKVGVYTTSTTSAQFCSKTPGFAQSGKHTSPGRQETSDDYKSFHLVGSSASERNRFPWNSKLASLYDGQMKPGKLPDFIDISKDCLQLQTDEDTGKSNDCAAKTSNKFNSDYIQRTSEDKQESAGDAVGRVGTRSLEKDQSSHNAKWTRGYGKKCSKPDSEVDAKESSEKCLQGINNITRLIENALTTNKTVNDKCTQEDISPRQTTSSVDEKLMKTVHSIKEDIEGVLQMLSSLDSHNGDKDVATSLLNEAFSRGKPFTTANVNCATDFVKQAFDKLISFKNSLLMQHREQDEANGYSYDDYKKGRDDYIADPDILEDNYNIENIFSYKNMPKTSNATRSDLNYGTEEKGIPKYYSEKPKARKKPGTPKSKSASRKTGKKSVFEKMRWRKKGTSGGDIVLGGFEEENASVTEVSQNTATEYVEPTFLYKRHEREQAKPGKKTSESLKSLFKDNSKKLLEDSRHKVWRPFVSNIHGPTVLKHTGAGDRATLAFVSSNSKSRKSSPSPATNKDDLYAYSHYPTPTFLDSPVNRTAESKHNRKHMKIKVERVMPRRSSSEKERSKSPNSNTSLTDLKRQKVYSRNLPLKKSTGAAENMSPVVIKRNKSNLLTNDKKNTGISDNKSRFASSKKDTKEAQMFTAKGKGDNKMASPQPKWKAPRHAQDRNERNSSPSTPESSSKVTGGALPDTTQTVHADFNPPYETVSQDGTLGTEMFVSKYTVVSEGSETSSPEDPMVEEEDQSEQLKPSDVPGPTIVTPSSGRRSRRASRRTRSRSRSRNTTKRRKKSKVLSEQRASDTARFSSSDTSLLKTDEHVARDKAAKINVPHNQEQSESTLQKPSPKTYKESWFPSDTQKSPSGRVSEADIDVARSEKSKYSETAAARESKYTNEYYGNSANATLETMAWPLHNGYERAGTKRKPKSDTLFSVKDKKSQKADSPRLDMSTSELNVSIKKLYEEINKLRLQLEASAEDAMLRPLPQVEGEIPFKFARSYKVFTNTSPKIPEPVYSYGQTPDFSYRNIGQQHSQPASCQSNGRFSETPNVQTYSENIPPSYDRIHEFVAILENHMRNFHSSETKVDNSSQVPTMESAAESCDDNRKKPASKDNAYSCTMEASQSVATAREVSNWLNEEVYVTATCDTTDISDTQNDATDKFETAASDNDYSSPNYKDAKSNQAAVGTTAYCSVNNNMRPSESGRGPDVITVYQKSLKVEQHSPNCRPGKAMHFQNTSSRMYEVSSENVDKTTEYHQNQAICLDSSDKRDRQCLVELCAETARRFKDDAAYVSFDSDMNTRVQCDPRSLGQSLSALGNIASTVMENSSQNKGSPAVEMISEKLRSRLQATQSTSSDTPTSCKNNLDREQTNNDPFFVKCVKGIFLGSTAAASVMAGSSPMPINGKQSPKGYSANVHRFKNVSKEPVAPGSDADEVSVAGYIDASRDSKRYNSSTQHNSFALDCAPVMKNYLPKKQRSPESCRSQSRTQLQEITSQNNSYLLNRDLRWDNGLQCDSQWSTKEVAVSCGMNNKSKTLMSRNLPMQSSAARLEASYSPAQTHIMETDKVMNHYSDAISAKVSQRFRSPQISRVGVATMARKQDYISGTNNSDFSESDRRAYHEGNSKDLPQKTPNSNKDLNDFNIDTKSSLNISEYLHDNEAFLVPGIAPDTDQHYIIASFENMMRQRRPYYVEHCGFRQKKPDTLLEQCNLGRLDVKTERNEFSELKATFQVVTVANDNNSSVDLNLSTIMAHDFHKNKEQLCEDVCDANGADENIGSETIVAVAVGLEDEETFWSNDEIERSIDIPDAKLCTNHNKYNNVGYWDAEDNSKDEGEGNLGKSLLKPEASMAKSDGEEAGISAVHIDIEDCRESSVDEISNDSGNLLLDTDEAESWYKTTEEVSDIASSMKKSDDNIVVEESDDDGNVEEEIVEESEDTDYEQQISDGDDNADDYDSNDYNQCDD